MKVLAVDVGTGTQDILLYETEREPENALKMVMPSPTLRLAEAVRDATRARDAILLTGVTMGGGPCGWAVQDHLRAGLRVYATPDAARTLDDDLEQVSALGVTLLGDDEARGLTRARHLVMADVDYPALVQAFACFGVDVEAVDLLAVAVFDHGAAPPGCSDRLFRFEYLADRIRSGGGLAGFAFPRDSIPASMTRLRAAAASAPAGLPVLAMDTAPAAVLGALEDNHLRGRRTLIVANVGNFHTLAFHLRDGAIAGLFEHHTGLLSRERLEALLLGLAQGSLSHDDLFADHGHGAVVLDPTPGEPEILSVTGPRRGLLAGSALRPHQAVPYGDMMMAGCWGLVRAAALRLPWAAQPLLDALGEP